MGGAFDDDKKSDPMGGAFDDDKKTILFRPPTGSCF